MGWFGGWAGREAEGASGVQGARTLKNEPSEEVLATHTFSIAKV